MTRATLAGVLVAGAVLWSAPGGLAVADGVPEYGRLRLRVSGQVTGVRSPDLDGDGRRDLVCIADRRLLVFLQRAEGFTEWADHVADAPPGAFVADVWEGAGPAGPAANPAAPRPPLAGPAVICVDRQGAVAVPWTPAGFGAPVRVVEAKNPLRAGASARVLVRPLVRDATGDGRSDLLIPVTDGYEVHAVAPDGRVQLVHRLAADLAPRVALLEEQRGRAIYTEFFYPPVTTGDADGDGRPDVCIREQGRVAVFVRAPDGALPERPSFTLDTDTIPREKRPKLNVNFPLDLADITGDGILDFIQPLPGEGTVLLYAGRPGRRTFGPPDAVIRTDGYAVAALPRDLDGDGRLDLLVGTIDRIGIMGALQVFMTKRLTVHSLCYYNPGTDGSAGKAAFPDAPGGQRDVDVPLGFATTEQGFQLGTSALATFDGDYDGDGRRDLLVRVTPTTLGIFCGRADRGFGDAPERTVTVPALTEARFVIPTVVDLNGDGRSDLVLHYRDWEDQQNQLIVLLSKR